MFFDRSKNIGKLDLGGESVTVVDDWCSIWTIPTVHWGDEREREKNRKLRNYFTQTHTHADSGKYCQQSVKRI